MGQRTGKPGCEVCGGRGGSRVWISGKLRWVKCRLCHPKPTKESIAWQRYANSIGAKNPAPHPDEVLGKPKQGRLFS